MSRRAVLIALALFTTVLAYSVTQPARAPATAPSSAEPSVFAGAYRFGSCATTPTTTWRLTMAIGRGRVLDLPPRPMIIGGHLATQPIRNLWSGMTWWLADEPRPLIHLRATRLDRDTAPLDLEAFGRAAGEDYPKGFDHRWMYVTSAASSETLPTPSGCWKIAYLDGDPERDVIVVELRGVAPPR
jgi:hypothetical protein